MAAISSGVARPAVSSITETRYRISDHLLWSGAPLVGGRSPLLRTRLPRSDTAGRPVDLKRYALREGSRFDQVERHVRAGAGEQPRALADDHGADEQGDLVD